VPAARVEIAICVVLPESVAVPIVVVRSKNVMVPVAVVPDWGLTVAVSVMDCANAGVYVLEAIAVVVGSRLTVCVKTADVPARKFASPL
jgi:hypothetical protein